jgi:hypothetical protein
VAIVSRAPGAALAHPHNHPLIIAGKVSTFGPPGEGAGTTASGTSSGSPGIALWDHRETLGRSFCVTLNHGRLHAVLPHTDVGPAPWTGRAIDITGAGVAKFRGRGHFATDAQAHARLLPRRRGPAWRCGVR